MPGGGCQPGMMMVLLPAVDDVSVVRFSMGLERSSDVAVVLLGLALCAALLVARYTAARAVGSLLGLATMGWLTVEALRFAKAAPADALHPAGVVAIAVGLIVGCCLARSRLHGGTHSLSRARPDSRQFSSGVPQSQGSPSRVTGIPRTHAHS